MAFGIKRRKQIMRLTDRLSITGKNEQRKQNQRVRAEVELRSIGIEPTARSLRRTIRSRSTAAIEVSERIDQLHALKKNLAGNPAIAQQFVEMAEREQNPEKAKIYSALAGTLMKTDTGEQSKEMVKKIMRDLNNPITRKRVFYEMKHGITPNVKALVEEINRMNRAKRKRTQ